MNKELLKFHLAENRKWIKNNETENNAEIKERIDLQEKVRCFLPKRLQSLTEEELFELISPLWAMSMWGNKQMRINQLIADNTIELLQKQLANLIFGKDKLAKRWDEFNEKVKGFGAGMMSELLAKYNPSEYILWNSKVRTAFIALGIPKVSKGMSTISGDRYEYLCRKGKEIVKESQNAGYKEIDNLFTLNYFMWRHLQIEPTDTNSQQDLFDVFIEPEKKSTSEFIHNDIRDKIRDIGQFLGFSSSIEKLIVEGSRVDAIWEAAIGNMGRVIYVFEVQTSGSIDSLINNLMNARSNPAVQAVVAVSDNNQIAKIKAKTAQLEKTYNLGIKYWNYEEVLKVHEALQFANESINKIGLVPDIF